MSDYIIEDNRLIECAGKDLLTADVPEGIEEISENAFAGCRRLISVQFPKSLKKIDDGAFRNCIHLASADLSGVSILGAYVFEGCFSLASVSLGENIGYLRNGTFLDCMALEKIKLPQNITYIGCECFKNCQFLKEIEMDGVMEIDASAFEGCASLYSLNLTNEMLHIAPYAFSYCKNLKSVTIRNRFIDIDELAFEKTVNIIIKAVQYSAAYKYAVQMGYRCIPSILDERSKIIDESDIEVLKESGVMFQKKPHSITGKAIIRFDKSQESKIDDILRGAKN